MGSRRQSGAVTSIGRRQEAESAPTSDLGRNVLTAAKGSGYLAGGSFFEFASRLVIALLLARLLGAQGYGLYVLAISAAAMIASVSTLGLDDAMVRYVAILSGRRDGAGLRGTLQIGLGVSAVAGAVMGGVLYLAAQPLAEGLFGEPRLTPLLRVLAAVVPFLTISNALAGTARGFRRMDYAAFAENVVQSLVRMVLLGVVALAASGLSVFTAAVIFGISDVAATVVFIVLLRKQFVLEVSRYQEARRDVREVFGFAFPLWLSGILRQSRRNIETLILGALTAASTVGVYAVVMKVNLVGHVCLLSISVAVKPTLAQLHDRGDRAGLANLYTTATKWAFTLALPFFLVMVLYPKEILLAFGGSFAAGSTALVILACAELVNAGTGICGPVLDMTRHTRVKLANAALWTGLLIASDAVLIPRWGVVGAATASLIAIGTVNVLSVAEVWALERLVPFDRSFWKPVAASLGALATGLLVGVLYPVSPDPVSAALHATVVVAAYLGLLLLFGLSADDRLVIERTAGKISEFIRRRRRPSAPAETSRQTVTSAVRERVDERHGEPAVPWTAPGPVYIGGLDRCGKTTMAAFLTSHPNIAVPAVGSNMWTYFYGQFGNLSKPGNFERCLDAMLRYKHVRFLEPDPERIRREFAAGPATYARLFSLFLVHYAEREGKPRWGVQTGLIERYADHLFTAHPGVKIIHMVRDPRDRYEGSLALWPDGRGRAGGAAARWTYSVRLAERNRRRYREDYMVVRYEDMVLRTEEVLQEVCGFLGETFYPEMLGMPAAPERRARLIARSLQRPPAGVLSSEFIGRFRRGVPRHELAFIQLHTRRLMRKYGYALDPLDLSIGEWARITALRWPSQFARMVTWRGVEAIQHRLPAYVGRKPDPRMIVEAPVECSASAEPRESTAPRSKRPQETTVAR
jgi:O-antigen/teichoic acid export membrane protein